MLGNYVTMCSTSFKLKFDSSTRQESEKQETLFWILTEWLPHPFSFHSFLCETVHCYQYTAVKSCFFHISYHEYASHIQSNLTGFSHMDVSLSNFSFQILSSSIRLDG